MMNTNNQKETSTVAVAVAAPSLPKGGGAIQGMGEALGSVGMSGMASFSIPLPISPGRGYAPGLGLSYSSGAGNSEFSVGWGLSTLAIRRRTSSGVPLYQTEDIYLAPSGDVMVPEFDEHNQVVSSTTSTYGDLTLDQSYTVTRYFPCIEGDFSRFERWSPADRSGDFWLIHSPSGELLCLGKSAQARIADPDDASRIGAWLVEESVTLTGEHIAYSYSAENTEGVLMTGSEQPRRHTANRYLTKVEYGNVSGYAPLYAWQRFAEKDAPNWLFSLVLDYGERTLDPLLPPTHAPVQSWQCREDSFSDYSFGFEVRTHRLCHQVLMFNHFPEELQDSATLVSRLLLSYLQTPQMSQLISVETLAYERDGKVQSIPPLDLTYSVFADDFNAANYTALPAFPALNDGHRYQMVDLYGEGVPGVLYRAGNDWRYRAPMRGSEHADAVDYAPWQPLPQLPSLLPRQGERQALMDLTGDGRLDWLIVQPGLAGYFSLSGDRSWSGFVPYPVFPSEFLHPNAQLAELVGTGLSDLVLIGPKSVRLYGNRREDGFSVGQDVARTSHDRLPLQAGDSAALVAFSDVLGSGQQHLVQIRHNLVTCWPNLGRGAFGQPIILSSLPFDVQRFNPDRVFLADLDGSGAADLIYAESDHFLIFMNQSGNGFSSTPRILPMPSGVRFDALDQVSFADLNGSGSASLLLSVSHMQPQHWRYNFAPQKPYLLTRYDNNMGMLGRLDYRSSAQEWLDEKQSAPLSVCELPFAMQLVRTVTSVDEINGNQLTQQYRYRRGVYDGRDREFRGFGFVQHLDTQAHSIATAPEVPLTPPSLTRVWYHTGQEGCELRPGVPAFNDPKAFPLGPSRFSRFNSRTKDDELLPVSDDVTRFQLYRALKGTVMRKELYGIDGSALEGVPYSVQTRRSQVRLLQPLSPMGWCITLPSALETLSVIYERIEADPQVQQQVTLQMDEFGSLLWSVAVSYGRRAQPSTNPYPAIVTEELWRSSYDEGQAPLRLTEVRNSVYHLIAPTVWRLSLPYQQRQNVLTYSADYDCYPLTANGLSYEALREPYGLLGSGQIRQFMGQSVAYYFDAAGTGVLPEGTAPPPLALMHHQETAELDDEALTAYEGLPDIDARLTTAGYLKQPKVLSVGMEAGKNVWIIPSGFSTYLEDGQWLPFYRPRTTQSSSLVAPQRITYDAYSCAVLSVTDGLGSRITSSIDYRFLKPWRVIDANENTQEVLFDALGRVLVNSAYGRELDENGATVDAGFSPLSAFNSRAAALASIQAALTNPSGAVQESSGVYLYDLHGWMGASLKSSLLSFFSAQESQACLAAMRSHHLVDEAGRLRGRAYLWATSDISLAGVPESVKALVKLTARSPVQIAVLLPDLFPTALDVAQIQIGLSSSDGFGRQLQAKQKHPPGLAYVVDANGELVMENGRPVEQDTGSSPRWAVSGRVEYDNKGQIIRTYQPYFINQPIHVKDQQIQASGYADTHYYDPLGRETTVFTALGYLRRFSSYPWFTVVEDENDTLQASLTPVEAMTGAFP